VIDPLVQPAWLADHLGEVFVADVRWSPAGGTAAAEEAFEAGHVPGAVFFDVDRDLAATPFVDGPGRHPLPSPEAFARTLSSAGFDDGATAVVYDDVGGSVAARLWWMLDATGRRAAMLDGGLAGWTGSLETGPSHRRPPNHAEPRPWSSDRLADAQAVADALEAGTPVLDARAAERYRAEVEPFDPVAGHVPGARSAPWGDHLDTDGRFLSPDALRERFEALGVTDAGTAVVYCGSGVTSCHDLFAMRLAGLGDARLYEGSWSDWVHNGDRPVATGADP
jgi:thiosulfate/3-mercaptopyruvate sulfurtransferase